MYKIGILGAAGISHDPSFNRHGVADIVIHAVASRRPGAAQAYADTHRIPVSYGS